MASLGVHPTFLQTVGNQLLAGAMALKTIIYALLHFVCHGFEHVFK